MVSFGYWNATMESFVGFFWLDSTINTVDCTACYCLLNPDKYKKYCSKQCSGKYTQIKYMSRNPLREKIMLKTDGKVSILAFLRGINQATMCFGVKQHSSYTMEHIFDKIKYRNSIGNHFA